MILLPLLQSISEDMSRKQSGNNVNRKMKSADALLLSMFFKHMDKSSPSNDESEDLGDVIDREMNCYINNKKEAHYKKIIWERINKDYLQEQAAKRLGRDVVGAAAVVKKSKKRQRKTEAPINNPAQADTEATREMLTKKRLSSKFNFDVLDKLLSDEPAPGSNKKQEALSSEDNSSSGQSHCRNQLEEDLEDNHADVMFEEDFDNGCEDHTEAYGNEYYDFENEEEYGYGYGEHGADEEY